MPTNLRKTPKIVSVFAGLGARKRCNMRMKTFIYFPLSIAVLWFACVAAAGQQEARVINIVNKTGTHITQVYVSPAGKSQWGDNLLQANVLENGQQEQMSFKPEPKVCKYDIRAVKINGKEMIFKDLNLCHMLNVTLLWEDDKPCVVQNIILENRTGFTFSEVFISEADQGFWSPNLLGSAALLDGNDEPISFQPEKNMCFYDVKVTRLSGREVIYRNVDLCNLYRLRLYWGEGVPYYDYNYPFHQYP